MPRRNHQTAQNGQVYAVEWPEWHVNCAAEGCEEHLLVALTGACFKASEAEKKMLDGSAEDMEDDKPWRRRNGLWYCPKHIQ